jgi:ubiquinone/menaquinone biosynthesis C-methylase UbiE
MRRLARAITRDDRGVAWLAGTAEHLPLPDGSVTVAWSLATVHHWKDVAAGLAEAKRVLAPAGRFLVIERCVRPDATGLASHGWTEQQAESFAAQCRAVGLESVRVEQRDGSAQRLGDAGDSTVRFIVTPTAARSGW